MYPRIASKGPIDAKWAYLTASKICVHRRAHNLRPVSAQAASASSDFKKYRARKKKFEHEGRPFIDVHLAARKRMYVWHHDMTCGIMVQSSAAFGVMRRALRAITELEARFARNHRVRRHSSMHSAARKRMYVWHHDMTCGIMVQSSAAFGVMRRALRAITELEARFARIHRVRRLRCYVVSTLFAHSTRGLSTSTDSSTIDRYFG